MTSLTKALILLMALNVFNDETIVSAMDMSECIAKSIQLGQCSSQKWNVQGLATGQMSDRMCCSLLNADCATNQLAESVCKVLTRDLGSLMESVEKIKRECKRRNIKCSQLKTSPLSDSCKQLKEYLDCKPNQEIPVHITPKPKPEPAVNANPTVNKPKTGSTSSHLISGPTLVIASIVVVIVIHVFN